MKLDIDTLNAFLEPLGIIVISKPFQLYYFYYEYRLVSRTNWKKIYFENDGHLMYSFSSSIETLFKNIISCKTFLVFENEDFPVVNNALETIYNPYFGSRSLEEMMMRKDLIGHEDCT